MKYKKSRPKVQVDLPRKKPRVFKPAFAVPLQLLPAGVGEQANEWNEEDSIIRNYWDFGVVANPNLLSVRAPQILQGPFPPSARPTASDGSKRPTSEFEPINSGSNLKNDDLKSALGKKRRDGKTVPLQLRTTI